MSGVDYEQRRSPGSLSPAKTAAGIADGAAKTRGQAVMAAAKSFFVGHG